MERMERELTRTERKAIQKLVKSECANYSREYGCLQLNDACYMLGKCWTGSYCKYFRNAVLPLERALEKALTDGGMIEMRMCRYCDEAFPKDGNKAYCSDACTKKSQRRQQREHMRKKRCGC